ISNPIQQYLRFQYQFIHFFPLRPTVISPDPAFSVYQHEFIAVNHVLGLSLSVYKGESKAATDQLLGLLLRSVQKKPLPFGCPVFGGVVCQNSRRVIFGIHGDGKNLYLRIVPKGILNPFHFRRHYWTYAWAAGKEKIHNCYLTFHIRPSYPRTVLGIKSKLGNIMLLA